MFVADNQLRLKSEANALADCSHAVQSFPIQLCKGWFGTSNTQKLQFCMSQAIPSVKFGATVKKKKKEDNSLTALPGVPGARCRTGLVGREESLANIRASFEPQLPSAEAVRDVGRAWAPLEENVPKRRATGRWRPVTATTGPQTLLVYRAPPKRPKPLFQLDFSIVPCVGPSGAAPEPGLGAFPWKNTLSQAVVTDRGPKDIHFLQKTREGSCPQLLLLWCAQVLCPPVRSYSSCLAGGSSRASAHIHTLHKPLRGWGFHAGSDTACPGCLLFPMPHP